MAFIVGDPVPATTATPPAASSFSVGSPVQDSTPKVKVGEAVGNGFDLPDENTSAFDQKNPGLKYTLQPDESAFDAALKLQKAGVPFDSKVYKDVAAQGFAKMQADKAAPPSTVNQGLSFAKGLVEGLPSAIYNVGKTGFTTARNIGGAIGGDQQAEDNTTAGMETALINAKNQANAIGRYFNEPKNADDYQVQLQQYVKDHQQAEDASSGKLLAAPITVGGVNLGPAGHEGVTVDKDAASQIGDFANPTSLATVGAGRAVGELVPKLLTSAASKIVPDAVAGAANKARIITAQTLRTGADALQSPVGTGAIVGGTTLAVTHDPVKALEYGLGGMGANILAHTPYGMKAQLIKNIADLPGAGLNKAAGVLEDPQATADIFKTASGAAGGGGTLAAAAQPEVEDQSKFGSGNPNEETPYSGAEQTGKAAIQGAFLGRNGAKETTGDVTPAATGKGPHNIEIPQPDINPYYGKAPEAQGDQTLAEDPRILRPAHPPEAQDPINTEATRLGLDPDVLRAHGVSAETLSTLKPEDIPRDPESLGEQAASSPEDFISKHFSPPVEGDLGLDDATIAEIRRNIKGPSASDPGAILEKYAGQKISDVVADPEKAAELEKHFQEFGNSQSIGRNVEDMTHARDQLKQVITVLSKTPEDFQEKENLPARQKELDDLNETIEAGRTAYANRLKEETMVSRGFRPSTPTPASSTPGPDITAADLIPKAPTSLISETPPAPAPAPVAAVAPPPTPKPLDIPKVLIPEEANPFKAKRQAVQSKIADLQARAAAGENVQSQIDDLQKDSKTAGMKAAALERQQTGNLTDKEKKAAADKEASNYQGKQVLHGDLPATIQGQVFGKTRIKYKDGTTKLVDPRELTAVPQIITPPAERSLPTLDL